jgi:DNA-binding winged helix-turn-helix (wHTH) protein/Tol biopolymer transport system component
MKVLNASYQFGPFALDTASHQLLRDGEPVPLAPKAFDTLLVLVRNADRVVTKEELLQAVWPDAFVTEDSLTQSIWALRRALGDQSSQPEFIATVPKRGYRFIAPVNEIADQPPAPAAAPRPRAGLIWVGLAAAALAGFVAGQGRTLFGARPALAPMRFVQDAPAGTHLVSGGVVSPDGRHLAFIAEDDTSGTTQIWVRPLDASDARPLAGTDGAGRPFWSPDGRSLGYFADSRLKTVGIGGEPPRTIAVADVRNAGGSWSERGVILFAHRRSPIYAVNAAGGTLTPVTSLGSDAQEASHRWPQVLPGGSRFLYFVTSTNAERAGTYLGSIDSPQRVRILDGAASGVTFAPPDALLFVRERVLMAQRFDPDQGRLLGTPVTLAGNVPGPTIVNGALVSASPDVLAFGGGTAMERLVWYSRRGDASEVVDAPTVLHNATLSRDGRLLLTDSIEPDRTGVWLSDLERGTTTRLVENAITPVWSPDGMRLAYALTRGGVSHLFTRSVSGGEAAQPLLEAPDSLTAQSWSNDGRYLVYGITQADTKQDLWLLPLTGADRRPLPLVRTPANESLGRLSPDGRWLAYASDESGMWQIYVQSFPVAAGKRAISIGGGSHPHWRVDGRELFYLASDRTLLSVQVGGDARAPFARPQPLFRVRVAGDATVYQNRYAATPDGQRFVIDAVDAAGTEERISVMVHWATRMLP